MRKPRPNGRGSWAGILLLALLLFRAYVPAGFMPANGVPFALELCPAVTAGMPAHLHHHAGTHHAETHADFESCPFGSAPGAGPISQYIGFVAAAPAVVQRTVAFQTPSLSRRAQRSHQPRGPPSLA
jgi:hypothetical protein